MSILHQVDPKDLADIIERWGKALTVDDLAGVIAVSIKQIYSLVKRGSLPHYRIASSIRFDPYKTADWLRSQNA